jgi:hypothetical protein
MGRFRLDLKALLFATTFSLVAISVLWLASRVATKYFANRLAESIAKRIPPEDFRKLKPESEFLVEVSDTRATCRRANGVVESVEWNDLRKVAILTTDAGPFAPDMFWVLEGPNGGCVIPWGATGERRLIDRLQALPGFRNDAIVNAAGLTVNNLIPCWEREPANGTSVNS